MLVHLCKSIHYNQLHEYSKVVFNTFGTVSFVCFSPLLHFFFHCWMFFSNDFVHSIGTWKSIWNHLLLMHIYVAGCHYLTCKKKIIYFTHSQNASYRPINWQLIHFALHCFTLYFDKSLLIANKTEV